MFLAEQAAQWNERAAGEEWPLSEYELLARVHVTGVLDLGFLQFHYWELPNGRHGTHDTRASWLGLLENPKSNEHEPKYGKDGKPQYYLAGHVPNELAILLTTFTRAHFVYGRMLKSRGNPFMNYFSHGEVARTPLDGAELNVANLKPRFDMAVSLGTNDPARAARFMLASKFYHEALPHVEDDHDLAYVFLTSAIEPLLRDFDPEGITLDEVNEDLAGHLRAKLEPADYLRAESLYLDPLPKIKARFVRFIMDHVHEQFWDDPSRPEYKLTRDEWPEMLHRIYKARSRLLHDGLALPPQHNFESERALGLAAMAGNRRWERKELLPHVRSFERLVHHTLMGYLERHTRETVGK